MKYKHNDYYGHINRIQEYAIQHPEWFWSNDAKAHRQWLYDNGASSIIDTIYEETPDNLKPKDFRKLPDSIRTQKLKDKIYKGQKDFIDTSGSVFLQTAPIVAAAPALVASPFATIGGFVGGALGGLGIDKIIQKKSNYDTFGEFVRQNKNWGETKSTLAEFLNPGAILGGAAGSLSGRVLDVHWRPFMDYDESSAYRIVDKKGFESVKHSGEVTSGPSSNYPHFTKGKSYGSIHNDEFLIETKTNPNFHLGRFDTHGVKSEYFTANDIKVGDKVTPVITKQNIPINLDASQVNIYKKTPLGFWLKNVKSKGNIGRTNYGNLMFIRNVGEIPEIVDGKVLLSPKDNIFTNMTYDQSFITHKNYRIRPGEDYLIIDPIAFENKKFKSIEPMDSFIKNEPIDKKYIKILSGNPEKLNQAKNMGYEVISDPKLIQKFLKIKSTENTNVDRINLNKKGFGYLDGVEEYDKLANEIIKQKFGEVDYSSVKALENVTGLKSGVHPDNFDVIYDFDQFAKKVNTTPMSELKDIKFSYPNGRSINPFQLKNEVSPEKIMSRKLGYDPTTHAEIEILGEEFAHPTKQMLLSNPRLRNKIESVKSYPILNVIK